MNKGEDPPSQKQQQQEGKKNNNKTLRHNEQDNKTNCKMARQMQRTQRKTISLLTLDVLHSPVTGYLDFTIVPFICLEKPVSFQISGILTNQKLIILNQKNKNMLSYFLCFSKLYYCKKQTTLVGLESIITHHAELSSLGDRQFSANCESI